MKLIKLEIRRLFNHFNHVVNFEEGKVTIITAPNGYGKTICLRIIDAIFNRNLTFLARLNFSEIFLKTSLGTLLIENVQEEESLLQVSMDGENQFDYDYTANENSDSLRRLVPRIERYIPFLTRVGSQLWEDDRSGEVYGLNEIADEFPEYFPNRFLNNTVPDWFNEFSESLTAHFIQDQRLIQKKFDLHSPRRSQRRFENTIERYASELSQLITDSGLKSARVAQELDSTFPVRLLDRNYGSKSLNAEDLARQLSDLQKKRNELSQFDLLAQEQHVPLPDALQDIQSEDTKVLTLYVRDTKDKLAAYENIYKKLELFSRILNERRLSFKSVKIDSQRGFYFITDFEQPLRLNWLIPLANNTKLFYFTNLYLKLSEKYLS